MAKKLILRKSHFYVPNPDPLPLPEPEPETGLFAMATVIYNGIDSGPGIVVAAAASNLIVLAPGYHKIASNALIPAGRTILAYGAHVEIPLDNPFWLQGATTFKGGTYFSSTPTSPKKLCSSTLAGAATLIDVTIQQGAKITSQNLHATTLRNCNFYSSSELIDAVVDNCNFHGGNFGSQDPRNGDVIVRGAMNMTNCRLYECRMVTNNAGLDGATFRNIAWYFKSSVINEGEALLSENADVVDCTFEQLYFYGCRLCIEFWSHPGDGSGDNEMTGNVFNDVTADTAATFLYLTGDAAADISGNTFERVFVKNVTQAIRLNAACGSNLFKNFYIDNITLHAKHDGMFYLPVAAEDRVVITDDGGTTSTYNNVNITGLNGATATNKSLPGVLTP